MKNIYSRKGEIDAAEQAKEITESSDQIQFATERGRRKAQKDAQKEALEQANEARKKAAKRLRNFGKAIVKTAAAAVKTVAGGGGALAITAILCVLLFVGSIAATPIGILFSNEAEAQPGDLVFYSDDSHVGIFGGWDERGNTLIIHCTSGQYNNVVITGVGNFAWIARPYYYAGT